MKNCLLGRQVCKSVLSGPKFLGQSVGKASYPEYKLKNTFELQFGSLGDSAQGNVFLKKAVIFSHVNRGLRLTERVQIIDQIEHPERQRLRKLARRVGRKDDPHGDFRVRLEHDAILKNERRIVVALTTTITRRQRTQQPPIGRVSQRQFAPGRQTGADRRLEVDFFRHAMAASSSALAALVLSNGSRRALSNGLRLAASAVSEGSASAMTLRDDAFSCDLWWLDFWEIILWTIFCEKFTKLKLK